jgi:cyclase
MAVGRLFEEKMIEMKNVRVIPRLDIKGPNLVKGIHLEGLRVLGKPEDFAQFYYENGADELMFIDVVASLYERNSLQDIITRTAKKIFIPLTVGGGIRTIDDIKNVLRAGADKVSLNTAAIKNPNIIKEASLKFGSSTIVVTIETIKSNDGKYLAYTDNGREYTGIDALAWAKKAEELGAGEIVLTSVDREGTGNGYDLELINLIASSVSIPVIVHGGPGKLSDISDAINNKADAVAVSSILHYDYIKKIISEGHTENEGNTEFLKSGKTFGKIETTSLPNIKAYLIKNNIATRQIDL